MRAAAKLLLVALAELKRHGGPGFAGIVYDYTALAERDPERFNRILRANRGDAAAHPSEDDILVC